jgi:hypothetical protein
MPRVSLLPSLGLVLLLAPLVTALILYVLHEPVQDWVWYLGYYIFLFAGPFLLGYGILLYPHRQYRTLAWTGLALGGSLTGFFLWLALAAYCRNHWGIILPVPL